LIFGVVILEFLFDYGLFITKTVTIVIAIIVVVGFVVSVANRQKEEYGELEVTNLSGRFEDYKEIIEQSVLDEEELKLLAKKQKLDDKQKKKEAKKNKKNTESDKVEDRKKRIYVLDFDGDIQASAVDNLRIEITAILTFIDKDYDEVLVQIESPGGVVHGYGLAASQLQRIRDRGIRLVVAVDKVAASGGYMMACVANHIIAAPFAILGSVGVLAQLPNFNKVLKKHDIDYEQFTAGEYKRTVTIFGENTEKNKQKFQEELEDTHILFKEFVSENRQQLDIDKIATGEHWYGKRAQTLNLCDEILTSDDYLLNASKNSDIFQVKYIAKRGLKDKIAELVSDSSLAIVNKFLRKERESRLV
jgi:serine protease SohB